MADLPPLRDVIRVHDLRAKKSLGQNFLLDLNLTDRIAQAAGPLNEVDVLEIGPGPGGLTRSLLRHGARSVIAIERDTRCIDALNEVAEHFPNRLTVVAADALAVDEADILGNHGIGRARVIANLPYNIGSKLLIKWLLSERWPPWYSSLSLLFQKEVAERIIAAPGSKTYGRLSVMANWRCTTRMAFDIPARAFTPPPNVTSSLVIISPRVDVGESVNPRDLEHVVGQAFGQRRKMIKSSLRSLGVSVDELLRAAEIDPTLRAEDVGVQGFVNLARAYCRIRNDVEKS